MNLKVITIAMALFTAGISFTSAAGADKEAIIGKSVPESGDSLLTPELLWSMGRLGAFQVSPQGDKAVYNVTYYSVEQNKSRTVIYLMDLQSKETTLLTQTEQSEVAPVFIDRGKRIAYMADADGVTQVWAMNVDGSGRQQLSDEKSSVSGFLFSPDESRVILVKNVPNTTSIQRNDADLPQATGMVINDLMYKHWDQYTTEAPHPFVAAFDGAHITGAVDILDGKPYESPMLPFGGIEQLAWSPDSKSIAYTCRAKTGRAYAISTDSDIYLYELATGKTNNLCKPEGYVAPENVATRSLESQSVNQQQEDYNVGYDQNPQFSPDGRYIAWSSMARDGYESDRTRLCVLDLTNGKKTYTTEQFESGVNEFCWAPDSRTLYFTGVWHGRTQVYRTDLKGEVKQLTDDVCDYSLVQLTPNGKNLIVNRQSMSRATEVYSLRLSGKGEKLEQLTDENGAYYKSLAWGDVKERWVNTVDGKKELCWVVYPPHFDPSKQYPALLFCEGGPQTPVSQSWSFRWNFQLMAAQGYIVIAPNRRGLPGFGMEWLESISGDYPGLCMQDYLSAIDDLSKEPYVDAGRLGAVGASFGGYSVYWLAGHHEKRFKCFIAHDGIYNTHQQYVETDELWFPNWDMKSAPWERTEQGEMQAAFAQSPHLFVDKWDTPILCIHGQRDFRIEYTQAESAFTAARMRGIDAQLLLFPDENHWVLKPQNGILWQRTFFRWLDKWLKK